MCVMSQRKQNFTSAYSASALSRIYSLACTYYATSLHHIHVYRENKNVAKLVGQRFYHARVSPADIKGRTLGKNRFSPGAAAAAAALESLSLFPARRVGVTRAPVTCSVSPPPTQERMCACMCRCTRESDGSVGPALSAICARDVLLPFAPFTLRVYVGRRSF